MKIIDLTSERLIYKRVSNEHISEDYVAWINDPAVNMYLETRGNYTIELLKKYIEEQFRKEIYFWAIHLKNSNKHIGNIKIDPINKETNSGEYGILIGDKQSWGNGYAKEASKRVIKYCFDELKLSKITLGVIEDNISAVQLYKKIGFTIDAKIKGTKTYNNKKSNSLRMSLVSSNSIHKFILGTVQMGLNYGINNTNGQVSRSESHEILKYAFDKGIKILDSAEAYGSAHEVIGSFHKKNPNNIFEVITKLPHKFNEDINDKVNNYIKDLQVNKLHALLFHSFSSYKENIDNFKVLINLKANGKIKYIGVSVYTNEEIEEVLLNDDVDVIQLPFNLFDNTNFRGEILAKAKSKDKIIHTRSALLQGLFFKDINSDNKVVNELKKELLELSKITKSNNSSVAKLALNYCMQQASIDNVLIGVDSKQQLIDNIKAINYKLESKAVNEINNIKVSNINLLNPSLWN